MEYDDLLRLLHRSEQLPDAVMRKVRTNLASDMTTFDARLAARRVHAGHQTTGVDERFRLTAIGGGAVRMEAVRRSVQRTMESPRTLGEVTNG